MRSIHRIGLLIALLGSGLGGFSSAAASSNLGIGRVLVLVGSAYVEAPDWERRPLACGDLVPNGEPVVVARGARLGVMLDEVYAQVDEGSRLTFGLTQDGAPNVVLQSGRVRVLDTRVDETSPRYRLSTPHVAGWGLGTDSEAYVLIEKAAVYSMLCEWTKEIGVARRDRKEVLLAAPGECVVAKPREPLYKARAHETRIALARNGTCAAGPILGPVAARFSPVDVAAAPPPSGLLPPAPPAFRREPCEAADPGCLDVSIGVVESPVSPGTIPGSIPIISPDPTPGTIPGVIPVSAPGLTPGGIPGIEGP
jgi:hypothetical protein